MKGQMKTIQEEPVTAIVDFWEMFMEGATKSCEFYFADELLDEKREEPMALQLRGGKHDFTHS